MLDRYGSSINMLVAGLVGLVLGLFIGWWVWPVEWSDAPGAQPALTASAPTSDLPAVDAARGASDNGAFLDWVNQALLYLAAVLLVAGGVVIGYQLLRQAHAEEAAGGGGAGRRNSAARRAGGVPDEGVGGRLSAVRRILRRHAGLRWPGNDSPREGGAPEDEPIFTELPVSGEERFAQGTRDRHGGVAANSAPRAPGQDGFAPAEELEHAETPAVAACDSEPDEEEPARPEKESYPVGEQARRQPQFPGSGAEPAGALQGGEAFAAEGEGAGASLPGGEEVEAGDVPLRAQRMEGERQHEGREEPEPRARSDDEVGRFEASYAFGVRSYDESFTITGEDGELLGACGMGINESVDRAAVETDEVRLLDVWLYDRSGARSESQPLVSPGFDTAGLEIRADGGGSATAAALALQPGLRCRLASDNIVLECRIRSVTFMEGKETPRPFRSVRASLIACRVS